ncbi:MAG: agmatinase, partial [Synergistaceae bacterium]
EMIEKTTDTILSDGKIPFMLGGEHLVTLGAVRAAAKKHKGLKILHFDAHADLRGSYMGEELSHATVIRRCAELLERKSVYQFGIRSMTKEEDMWAEDNVFQNKYDTCTLADKLNEIGDSPVYLTIDLDVLDPSIFPGTGTPEPGGISFVELISAVHKMSGVNIVACDVNELAPHYDASGVSTITACKVIRELLLILSQKGD